MAHKASPDSTGTSQPQKPFVRLDDIGNASLIVGIISGVFFIGSVIAIIAFLGAPDPPPPVVLFFSL